MKSRHLTNDWLSEAWSTPANPEANESMVVTNGYQSVWVLLAFLASSLQPTAFSYRMGPGMLSGTVLHQLEG